MYIGAYKMENNFIKVNEQKFKLGEEITIKKFAPIVLFTYNRPKHTKETIGALKENQYAIDSDLIIYSDAPKKEIDIEKVNEVREYLKTITGFKSLKIIEQNENKGLARSIIDGVTEIVNLHGIIIVLEDDVVVSKFFLKYVNRALECYKDNNKVMQVGTTLFKNTNKYGIDKAFFSRVPDSPCWATWDRAWLNFNKDPKSLIATFTEQDIKKFDLNCKTGFWQQVLDNNDNKINTWAIFWYASMFLNDGLVLYPPISMNRNIGFDGSGVHCDCTDIYEVNELCGEVLHYPMLLREDFNGYLYFKSVLSYPSLIKRIKDKIKKYIKNIEKQCRTIISNFT